MLDLSEVTADTFAPLAGSPFAVQPGDGAGGSLSLALVEVERHAGGAPGREGFSLTFEGPRATLLGQGVQRLAHDRLGELELFLVPVGVTETAFRYEAVFG
ncbi:MAG TPA: hypothetical protein VFW71_12400 [Actinomycetota bacterium]|nr:hypothetical protein [Actinomycetota bacterium]